MTRRRHITNEEAQLLARAMKDVRPRAKRVGKAGAGAKAGAAPSAPKKDGVKSRAPQPLSPRASDAKAQRRPEKSPLLIDRRTEQKLKRGRMEIEARLDLHGLTQQAAHFKLMHFIARSADEGQKAVLVITGKGSRGAETGVLRASVPRWLEEAPLRQYVHGVKAAGPRHGGAGALYVLLRRPRPAR